jgi:TPR repeat protein
MSNGMLATTAAARPSFLRHLIGLYRSDAAFRGVTDFTVVGVVVLVFLQFFPSKDGKHAPPQQEASQNATKPVPSTPVPANTQSSQQQKAEETPKPSPPQPAKVVPKVAIQFPQVVSNPALGFTRIFDIDQTAFRSSAAADQPRLAAAGRAARAQQFTDIANILADANAADPNVAFMRGIGLITAGNAESNKSAEQFWRSASDAGQRQAALELARISTYGPPGVTKNVEQGKRVIEAAAASGNRAAQRMAGVAYLSGQFGGLNPAKGRDYLRQAAQAGDAQAMLYYSFTLGWAVGGPADHAAAEDFLRRAAGEGLTLAQQTLGIFLLEQFKEKVIDDPREGIEWLEKAIRPGYSIAALRALALFLGGQKEPPWNDRSKVYQLARLCSGIKDPWCQAENGWVFRNGVGTQRNLMKAFAHYLMALELGNPTAAKSLEEMGQQISPADKAAAIDLSQKLRPDLKPVPTIWDVQYVGVTPPWRWSEAEASVATVAPVASTPPTVPATCTRVAYRQIADLCNNCTAPPWNGELKRTAGDEWTATFVDGNNKPGSTRWRLTSQSASEVVLYDASRDLYARFDLTARKGFLRRGASGNWTNTSEILSSDCHGGAQPTAVAQTPPREATLATCTRLAFRQVADLCNNCTAPPWNGEFKRTGSDEWTMTFVDGNKKPGTSRWLATSQSASEILLHDASRDMYRRFDLAAGKGFIRQGRVGAWTVASDILSTDCR